MRKLPYVRSMVICAVYIAIALLSLPLLMRLIVSERIHTTAEDVPERDTAIVLGASVVKGEPSPVLAARADAAAALYLNRKVKKVLITGDSRTPSHDEVTPVKTYLERAGVKSEDIVLDYAGLDTYSSMYRAQAAFGVSNAIVVTQDFHMPRALFIARFLGTDAVGALARGGNNAFFDYLREIPASWKALLDIFFSRKPKYLDDPLLPSSSG